MTTRLLIIGLDGATLDLIEPWARAGQLPNLAALIRRGSVGRLASTLPAMTLPAWSTFLTGCNPGRHGLFDFTRHVPGRYAVQFVNATHRQEPTFLRRMSDAGLRVAALGIPTTYPPEPINGVMIGGFDSPVSTRRDDSFIYPREVYDELRSTAGEFPLTDLQEVNIGPGWHAQALKKLTQAIDGQARVARHLLEREAWDCFAIVFGASDTVSHHFWAFHDPNSPRRDAAGAARFGGAIRAIYQQLDRAVGELLQSAGADADVFVVSDHGFGGTSDIAISINRYLNQQGLLNFKPRPGASSRAAELLKQAGLRRLPARAQQMLFRRLGAVVDRLESGARFGHIDWPRTLVYSEELNYFPSVWINLLGREPGGVVEPDQYEAVRDRAILALEQWIGEESGEYIVRRAYRREEVYAGPALCEAPDIVLELALDGGYSYAVEAARSPGPSLRRMDASEHIGAKGRSMNGSHRPEGVLIAAGPSIASGAAIHHATLADMAPTLLAMLEQRVDSLDGRILGELFVEPMGHRIDRAQSDAALFAWSPVSKLVYSNSDAALLAGRLRALGYIE
jgi:predicted AlkP superfamily phosphohydrolase/phosphomutase